MIILYFLLYIGLFVIYVYAQAAQAWYVTVDML